jgi:hypothetical protein
LQARRASTFGCEHQVTECRLSAVPPSLTSRTKGDNTNNDGAKRCPFARTCPPWCSAGSRVWRCCIRRWKRGGTPQVGAVRRLLPKKKLQSVSLQWPRRTHYSGNVPLVAPRAVLAGIQRSLRQLIQQRLGLLQIERVEAFGEPAVNRSQQFASLLRFALRTPEASEAHCGAEFQ